MTALREAVATCTESELRRLALCYLTVIDKNTSVDWASAAIAYDPKVQVASFRTVTNRLVKKLNITDPNGGTSTSNTNNDSATATPVKGRGKGGKAGGKRKVADADEDEDTEEPGAGGKKTKQEVKGKSGVKGGGRKAKGKKDDGMEESEEDTIRVKAEKMGEEEDGEGVGEGEEAAFY